MAQKGTGKPSPTAPYIAPAPSLQIPEPTVAVVWQRIGCGAIAANKIVTRQQGNGLIRVTQGKGGEASTYAKASVPQNPKT